MSLSDDTLSYDPFDPAVIDDPYPTYTRLREEAPTYWSERANCWVLSRHADVTHALADPATYSSASGIFPTPPGADMTQLFLPMLIMTDPPRHTELRRIVSKAFTPRRIGSLDGTIYTVTDTLLNRIDPTAPWDLVADFAGPMPAMVIADLLGIPRDDRHAFREWSTALVQANPTTGEGLAAAGSLYDYFRGFVDDRRQHPHDDLISDLVTADVDGERLTEDEVLGFCLLLLVAGHETTTNLLANSISVLAEHPEDAKTLTDDPTLVPDAVEELLRFESPVQGLARTLTRDVSRHDITMRTGDTVLLLFGAANRDELVFPDASLFDITRRPTQHVALGRGVHFCLGAPLARMETRIGLSALLQRGWATHVDATRTTRLRSGPIRGYRELVVLPT